MKWIPLSLLSVLCLFGGGTGPSGDEVTLSLSIDRIAPGVTYEFDNGFDRDRVNCSPAEGQVLSHVATAKRIEDYVSFQVTITNKGDKFVLVDSVSMHGLLSRCLRLTDAGKTEWDSVVTQKPIFDRSSFTIPVAPGSSHQVWFTIPGLSIKPAGGGQAAIPERFCYELKKPGTLIFTRPIMDNELAPANRVPIACSGESRVDATGPHPPF